MPKKLCPCCKQKPVHKTWRYCKACLYHKQTVRWVKRKIAAVAYLGNICMNCKKRYHPAVFDFHHKDPANKTFDWSKLRLQSWPRVLAELDKCDLLCANCHRLTHIKLDLWLEAEK